MRIGIIGAGRMGVTHQCIANSHPDAKVVAVADPAMLVTKLLSKYAGVATYKDYAAMLDKEALDAVLVCTPPAMNHDILQAVYAKRLHAFVEKPFALQAAQGRALAGMFDGAGLVNQVGYVNRFNDVFTRAKALADAGVIGKLIRFRSEMFSSTIVQDQGDDGWRSTHANGGGAMFEMASHAIDLIDFVIGKPDQVSGTTLTKVYSKNVEDIVAGSYAYRDGVTGSIYVNWSDESYRKPTNRLELFGTEGKIIADQYSAKVFVKADVPAHALTKGWNTLYITDVFSNVPFYLRGIEFTAQLYHFLDTLKAGGGATRCGFAAGADVLDTVEAMFADARTLEGRLVA